MTDIQSYITKRMNYLLRKAGVEFNDNTLDGDCELVFHRKDEWDAEEFDKALNKAIEELDDQLADHETAAYTTYSVDVLMKHDKCGADGLVKQWEVSISWDGRIPNAFDDLWSEKKSAGEIWNE